MNDTSEHQHRHRQQHLHQHRVDSGFTLIELVFVVVILGIVVGAVVFVATGMTAQAAETGCRADRHQLQVAAATFFVQRTTDVIPATGADHDRFEQTLVDGGFIRAASTLHDLDATGAVTPQENPSC